MAGRDNPTRVRGDNMGRDARDLLVNIIQNLTKTEERNLFELESSVGAPPLNKAALENARATLLVLQGLMEKCTAAPNSVEEMSPDEAAMLGHILSYNLKEEEREIAQLTAAGGGHEYIRGCQHRVELLRELMAAMGGQ